MAKILALPDATYEKHREDHPRRPQMIRRTPRKAFQGKTKFTLETDPELRAEYAAYVAKAISGEKMGATYHRPRNAWQRRLGRDGLEGFRRGQRLLNPRPTALKYLEGYATTNTSGLCISIALIDFMRRYNIDEDRIYLQGCRAEGIYHGFGGKAMRSVRRVHPVIGCPRRFNYRLLDTSHTCHCS